MVNHLIIAINNEQMNEVMGKVLNQTYDINKINMHFL